MASIGFNSNTPLNTQRLGRRSCRVPFARTAWLYATPWGPRVEPSLKLSNPGGPQPSPWPFGVFRVYMIVSILPTKSYSLVAGDLRAAQKYGQGKNRFAPKSR